MSDHPCSNSLLNPSQSGYKSGHSTETVLLEIVNDLLLSLDNGNQQRSIQLITTFYLVVLSMFFGIQVLHCNRSPPTYPTEKLSPSTTQSLILIPFRTVCLKALSLGLFCLFCIHTLSDVIEHHSIHHHSFADDTQLRKSALPLHVSELVQSMQECLHDVKAWLSNNKLNLNDDKIEAMIVSSQRTSTSLPMPDSLTVGASNVTFSQSVRTLGVTLDTHLTKKKTDYKYSQN